MGLSEVEKLKRRIDAGDSVPGLTYISSCNLICPGDTGLIFYYKGLNFDVFEEDGRLYFDINGDTGVLAEDGVVNREFLDYLGIP